MNEKEREKGIGIKRNMYKRNIDVFELKMSQTRMNKTGGKDGGIYME